MKAFISKTLLLIFVGILLTVLITMFSNKYISNKAQFKVSKKTNMVILGHSHAECAYNDSLIPSCKNLSASAEAYFYTFYKLLKLTEQNKNIKTIFLEFSNNQINTDMNKWIWEEPYLQKGYKKYAPFMSFDSKYLLLKNNPVGFFNSSSLLLNENTTIITTKNYNYIKDIGGYKNLNKSKMDSLLIAYKKNSGKSSTDISIENINYLKKIVDLCEQKKVKLYLIRTPTHKNYLHLENEPIFKKLLAENFSSLDFLDFKEFPLQDSEFADFEHLNYKGAKKYSLFFNQLLKNKILEMQDKQQFINQQIDTLLAKAH